MQSPRTAVAPQLGEMSAVATKRSRGRASAASQCMEAVQNLVVDREGTLAAVQRAAEVQLLDLGALSMRGVIAIQEVGGPPSCLTPPRHTTIRLPPLCPRKTPPRLTPSPSMEGGNLPLPSMEGSRSAALGRRLWLQHSFRTYRPNTWERSRRGGGGGLPSQYSNEAHKGVIGVAND